MKRQYLLLLILSVATAMAFSSCSEKENNESGDSAFTADGATKHVYSIAEGHTVHFSRGNLQYNAATDTWRFAENQYDIIGENNINISQSYNGWIDLFGWGTSGWNSGAVCYSPWDTSQNGSNYYPGDSYVNNLSGDYSESDWAWHNPIINGGNQAHKWRTLSRNEWLYLINNSHEQNNRANKTGVATIEGHQGLVILPDDWTVPSGLSFIAGTSYDTSNYSINTYTSEEWLKMEKNGAVFLPAAGLRGYFENEGNEVSDLEYGFYWSTTHAFDSKNCANDLGFDGHGFGYTSWRLPRYYGMSIRPVMDEN